jgi:drug/metabolite transporter (DMT)-like permease
MTFLRGYFFIILATLFWGFSATIAKLLFTQQIDTIVLVQMRITISTIILLIYFFIFNKGVFRVRLKDLYRFAALGIMGIAGSNFFYYFTIKETNVATAILLQYIAPLFVLCYAALTREEELTFIKLLAGIVSLGGCFLAIAGKDFSILHISTLGLLSGFASAFSWGFTNISLRHVLKDYSIWTALIYAFIAATLFWLFINPPWNIIEAHYSSGEWGIYVLVAVISVLIPHSCYFAGMKYLTPSRAIITATFEPIVAIVSAFFVVGEMLAPVQIAGAMLVISAIAILQLKQEKS